jgi:hypothetical protein
MTVSIMQPAYLPWLGYFDRLRQSDLHIILDHVNLDGNSKTKFSNRNKVRTPEGWTWLTVPLRSKGKHGNLFLNLVEVSEDSSWRSKHWQTLKSCYGKAPHFSEHKLFFEEFYDTEWMKLNDLIERSTEYLKKSLGTTCQTLKSSEMEIPGEKADLILNLCISVGATKYISGPFGRDYLDSKSFLEAGIELVFHDYKHPEYKQSFPGFEPYMSVVDLLFNHGNESMEIIAMDSENL